MEIRTGAESQAPRHASLFLAAFQVILCVRVPRGMWSAWRARPTFAAHSRCRERPLREAGGQQRSADLHTAEQDHARRAAGGNADARSVEGFGRRGWKAGAKILPSGGYGAGNGSEQLRSTRKG